MRGRTVPDFDAFDLWAGLRRSRVPREDPCKCRRVAMQEASEFGERCDMKIDCLSDERHANRGECTLPREGAQSIDADVVLVADPIRKFRQGHRAVGLAQMHRRLGEQRNGSLRCRSMI